MAYAHPEVLADTAWVEAHLEDPTVRIVEVDVDTTSYNDAHIPGSVGWNWSTELCDTRLRDIVGARAFEELMRRSGVEPETTIVLYGDNNNWFACWAFWQLKIYGHARVRLMDGGREKWIAEGRPMTTDAPKVTRTTYAVSEPSFVDRAFLDDVMKASKSGKVSLVDVRTPQEFTGEILAPPGLPETCQRGGHIPGAQNAPWKIACRDDGTFKEATDLEKTYAALGVTRDRPAVTYCRIGERSSHTWFALKYLLGFPDVRNYDGSWTEWGNLVRAPIER